MTGAEERSARRRIRDAALEMFAERGVDGTPLRAIAERAGVSTALVVHHFGTKDGLRSACDEHVAASVREQERGSVATGADPLSAVRASAEGPPVLRYLARTLVDGSPRVADLVDEMVADAEVCTQEAVSAGVTTPTDFPRERAAVLTLWSLGALVMHEHLHRLLGVDLTGDPLAMGPYAVPATEILSRGVITEEHYQRVRDAFAALPGPDDRADQPDQPAREEP